MLSKDELNNLRNLKKKIDEKEEELSVLYTILEGTSSPKFTDEPKGGVPVDILELYDKVLRKQRSIKLLSETYYQERERIKEEILILSPEGKKLICLRYCENFDWCDIAKEMAYTVRHLHRLHYKVLSELKKA